MENKDELKEYASKLIKNIGNFVTNNGDGTHTIKMPGETEDYVVKELTIREEQKAKSLATKEINENDMCILRSIISPKITSDKWSDLPARIYKRLSSVKNYLDGDYDFLV